MHTAKLSFHFGWTIVVAGTLTLAACGGDATAGGSTSNSTAATVSASTSATNASTNSTPTSGTSTASGSNSSGSSTSASSSTSTNGTGAGSSPPIATTRSASLSWNAPVTNADGTAITDLAGYHIYYGTNQASLSQSITISDPTETTYVLGGLLPGTYYFTVVAYNTLGVDSEDSNVASKTIT